MASEEQKNAIANYVLNGGIKVVRNASDHVITGIYANDVAGKVLEQTQVVTNRFSVFTRRDSKYDITDFDYHVDVPGFLSQFGTDSLNNAQELRLLDKNPDSPKAQR